MGEGRVPPLAEGKSSNEIWSEPILNKVKSRLNRNPIIGFVRSTGVDKTAACRSLFGVDRV